MKTQVTKNTPYLTKNQLEKIKSIIQLELLKRGFSAPITSFEEQTSKEHYLKFETANFQTTPVLFKNIQITCFNSKISKDTEESESGTHNITKFWITINASYTLFSGGTNGNGLFEMFGSFFEDEYHHLDYTIK